MWDSNKTTHCLYVQNILVLSYLNVPDALDAGRVDVGVVWGGDAARRLPQDAAATIHHPLKSGKRRSPSPKIKYRARLKGHKMVPRLRECGIHSQAEVIGKSSNKIHQTRGPPFSRAL